MTSETETQRQAMHLKGLASTYAEQDRVGTPDLKLNFQSLRSVAVRSGWRILIYGVTCPLTTQAIIMAAVFTVLPNCTARVKRPGVSSHVC